MSNQNTRISIPNNDHLVPQESGTQNICVVCGGPAPASSRCTNRRCYSCHRTHCTPLGLISPGHNPILIDVDGRPL